MRSSIGLLAICAMLSGMACAHAGDRARSAAGVNAASANTSSVIRNFARSKPPRAYAGQNPSQAARAQDRR
jgi:hypothetical protein